MEAFRRQQIIALKDTYVTLGVDEIAQKKFDVTGKGGDAGSKEETERVILAMVNTLRKNRVVFSNIAQIERGEIRATLSQSSSDPATSQTTVCFAGNPTADAASAQALEEQIKRIVALSSQVKHMDRKLGLTKEYLQFSSRNMKGGLSMPSLMGMDSEMMEDYGGGVWGEDDTDEVLMQDFDDDAGI